MYIKESERPTGAPLKTFSKGPGSEGRSGLEERTGGMQHLEGQETRRRPTTRKEQGEEEHTGSVERNSQWLSSRASFGS